MDGGNRIEILELLRFGTLETEGLLPWSSNYTFMVKACKDGIEVPAVYKPQRGERPLWDFPQGTLSAREYAAFLVSDALGWDLIPPTVLRQGEHGLGSVQLFIEHDPNQHYFTFEGQPVFHESLQKLVLLDVIINNADRKGGHVIIEAHRESDKSGVGDGEERLWGIDHGLSFHQEYKLRTVIWEFAGSRIPQALLLDLMALQDALLNSGSKLVKNLQPLLNGEETSAFEMRLKRLVERGIFPNPGPGRHYPWPPV
jgi:uncharacterized repeat protein (TIGR03843 family)